MLFPFRKKAVLFKEMAQLRHPGRKLRTLVSSPEPVTAFLIEMKLSHGAGLVHIDEELRGAVCIAAVGGGGQKKCRRKVLELLAGSGASGTVYQHQVIRPGADPVQRIGLARVGS